MINLRLLFLVFASCFFIACETEFPDLSPQPGGTLIEVIENGTMTVDEIISAVDELDIQPTAQYNVKLYSVTYRTHSLGKEIDSRGLLIIPDPIDSIYLISYFHGTQLPVELLDVYNPAHETPSNYKGEISDFREIRNMGLAWASAGYTVFMPDYVGFGLSDYAEHPYLYYPEMFQANIDGLLAAKSYLASSQIPYDNRLFLTGWSQGGGACLSAHRYIQELHATEFTVAASSGLAGPYNYSKFVDDILSRKDEELNIYNIFSWAIYALNKFSTLQRPTDQVFSYPVYDQSSAIFPPSEKPGEFLNDYFLDQIITGKDSAFRNEMDKNTFASGWTPVGQVFLHHGDADDVVYYYNSVDAYNGLTAAGGDVTLYTYPGGNHDTDLGPYIAQTLIDFNAIK